jgi:hypothetical protein
VRFIVGGAIGRPIAQTTFGGLSLRHAGARHLPRQMEATTTKSRGQTYQRRS